MAANPYAEGWRAWDERYADPVIGKRNWQMAAGCAVVVSLVLAVGMVWLLAQPIHSLRRPGRSAGLWH